MTDEEKVKNIISFLFIIFGENYELPKAIMDLHPDYLIEKFERYVLSKIHESDFGIHPSLRRELFNKYCEKYELEITL